MEQVRSPLEKKSTQLIAKDFNMKPEEITVEFMHKWRKTFLYPKLKSFERNINKE